jgi:hypothetical protein
MCPTGWQYRWSGLRIPRPHRAFPRSVWPSTTDYDEPIPRGGCGPLHRKWPILTMCADRDRHGTRAFRLSRTRPLRRRRTLYSRRAGVHDACRNVPSAGILGQVGRIVSERRCAMSATEILDRGARSWLTERPAIMCNCSVRFPDSRMMFFDCHLRSMLAPRAIAFPKTTGEDIPGPARRGSFLCDTCVTFRPYTSILEVTCGISRRGLCRQGLAGPSTPLATETTRHDQPEQRSGARQRDCAADGAAVLVDTPGRPVGAQTV